MTQNLISINKLSKVYSNGLQALKDVSLDIKKGEILASTTIKIDEIKSDQIGRKIKLLLASTLSEVRRRGSLSSRLEFDAIAVNKLGKLLGSRKIGDVTILAIALRKAETTESDLSCAVQVFS